MSENKGNGIFQRIYIGLIITFIILLGYTVYLINYEIINKEDYYSQIIANIASSENRSKIRNLLPRHTMDYVELLHWVDDHMDWVPSNITMNTRYTDPMKILENGTGRGRCGEHSYVYAAVCWANGYETRLVSAFVNGDHMWVEVKLNGSWIHIDPSPPQKINEPGAYAKKFYLFIYSYEADGASQYLLIKYNPYFPAIFLTLGCALISGYVIKKRSRTILRSVSRGGSSSMS